MIDLKAGEEPNRMTPVRRKLANATMAIAVIRLTWRS
jgi:hypothetical protein